MGSEIFLYLNSGSNSLVARVNARTEPAVGGSLECVFDMSKSHFFNAQTEESLSPAA